MIESIEFFFQNQLSEILHLLLANSHARLWFQPFLLGFVSTLER